MKKEIQLPKLPYGQGNYSWKDATHTRIKFRKRINGEYKSVTGTTVQECNKKMKELEIRLETEKKESWKQNPNNSALTLTQSAKAWMETFKLTTLKGKSYDTLESTFTNQIMSAPFANFQPTAITDMDIQNYLSDLGKKGYSISTIKKTYSFLNQYFSYVFRIRPYDNPMTTVQMPKFQNNISLDEEGNIENYDEVWGLTDNQYEILDDDEIVRFIYSATVPRIQGVQGYKHGWGLVFMMWTFIRNGEALGLQWKDIDFDKKTATVYKTYSRIRDRDEESATGRNYKWALSTVKSKSGVRTFYLSEQAIYALQEYRKVQKPKNENEFIFSTESGLPINNSNLNLTLAKILMNADIDKHVSVHGLRHTGISYFIRHNVDKDIVAKMAGHSNSLITDKVYYTILSKQEQEELDKINKMVKGDQSVAEHNDDYYCEDNNMLEDMKVSTAAIQDELEDMDDAMWEKFANIIEETVDELEQNGYTWSEEELANFDLY